MGNTSTRASCTDGGRDQGGSVMMPPLTAEPPRTVPKTPTQNGKSPGPGNPGEYEELGKKVKEQLFPQFFDGCKVVIQKGLSKHFQTMHTLTLGSSTQPSQWQFGATYVGNKKVAENDFRPVLIGDMSSSGNFTALILHQFGRAWRMKCNVQTQKSRWVAYQGSMDYQGSDFTASLTLANPDIISGSVVAVAQYLQALTPRLALGTEMMYQRGGGMQTALLSLGGYYKTEDWEATARLGLHAVHVTYQHKLKDLVLMAECEGSLMQGETSAAVGYKLDLGSMTVRGKIDSHATVGAVVEKRLDPLPATVLISGQINHWTDESKFGVALMVG